MILSQKGGWEPCICTWEPRWSFPLGDVLGIFDLDNTTSSRVTRDFLARAQQTGQVVSVGEDLPKSFLLCRNQAGRVTVYLSQLSSATLLRRVESGRFETI